MSIAVLFSRADAERFLADRPSDMVLPLTPAARAHVNGEAGIEILDPRARFDDTVQASCAERAMGAKQAALAVVAQMQPGAPALTAIVGEHVDRVAFTALRLWESLGRSGPWTLPTAAGWSCHETRDGAFAALLDSLLGPRIAGETAGARIRPPKAPVLYKALRGLLLRLAGSGQPRVLTSTSKGMFGLLATLGDGLGTRVVVARLAADGLREYARLLREFVRWGAGAKQLQLALIPDSPRPDMSALVDACLAEIVEPPIARALRAYAPLMRYRLGLAMAARSDAAAVVGALAPMALVAGEISDLGSRLLADACGACRVPRWVLGRNAHAATSGAIERQAQHDYFRARYPAGLVDQYLFWSPHGAAAAREALPAAAHAAIHAIAALAKAPYRRPSESRQARVLFADSFVTWWYPHPWIFQNSDEFVAGLAELLRQMPGPENAKLVVRLKHKPECPPEVVRRLLGEVENCEVVERDRPLAADLASADLVVSFRSTTIQEALFARTPVLLWGASGRHRHLAARETLPTPDDRAAVYAPAAPADLAPLLAAILKAHAGRPLTDEELAPHVWPDDTPGIGDFAQALAEGVPLRLWYAAPTRQGQPETAAAMESQDA